MLSTNLLSQNDIDYVNNFIWTVGMLAPELRANIEIVEKTGPYDRVTSADYELSRLIVKYLKERFPKDKIISEEDFVHDVSSQSARTWLIDPIDGTDNYIANDGQYSVMIGLLVDNRPLFGWVFAPANKILYFGGPNYGSWRKSEHDTATQFKVSKRLTNSAVARLLMGWRDRKNNPWVLNSPQVKLVKSGSVGLKVAKVLEDDADLFVHLSGKLKTWDTAGPVAIALGGCLEVGDMESDELVFPIDSFMHRCCVIIGKPGSLTWCRLHLVAPS